MDPPGGDDKWKLSSKGRSRSGRPHAMTDASSSSAGGSSSVLSRSYSASQQQQRQPQQGSKKKCVAEAVKEHRARFYIVRRCVSMLVCWRDY
uniref:Uncharacterized protein n=1 Tax=Setaria italica TaxID=4555 RepID=K3XPT4_SETIT